MWAPAQLCRIAEQEQVVEESHEVQSEEVSEGEVVDGSGLVCLRLFPSLCQREDRRVMKREWDLAGTNLSGGSVLSVLNFLLILRVGDCEGGPQVFCPSVRSGNVGAVDNTC